MQFSRILLSVCAVLPSASLTLAMPLPDRDRRGRNNGFVQGLGLGGVYGGGLGYGGYGSSYGGGYGGYAGGYPVGPGYGGGVPGYGGAIPYGGGLAYGSYY
ncbi:hypothetical protein Pst134EA_025882 [Puccinia striiformis f. sp. tritici]|uniref:hypothetical protein n=1 Tax=Puccinia striiformis f. sp. tritici TaxID=168172 RepID=UPI0020072472|nr:hypothetical protein Pst134EA_025882 [Puccinia striiformis f. sp. tritici]KAH9451943.1 hypothetical protein Pst134EA_025882 [Puccinia striiformis f. sp. tritici]